MNKSVREVYQTIQGFLTRMKFDNVNEFSAQASFFLILSVFPFIMLLLTIIHYTPLEQSVLLSSMLDITPEALNPLITSVINEMYEKASGTMLSLTAVAAIWSSSKGMRAITRGLHSVFHIRQKRNYFFERAIAILYTIVLLFAIILSLVLVVFGNSILHFLSSHLPFIYGIVEVFVKQRFLIILLVLSLLFSLLYKSIARKRYTLMQLLPGSLFSSLGWLIFSYAYSMYVNQFSNFSYMYGSLTAIVILMLWVYICMYILFIGGEINIYFSLSFQRAYKHILFFLWKRKKPKKKP